MPITRREHIPLPFSAPRYVPDTSRLQALYLRLGEDLAAIGMRKGAQTAQGLQALAGLYSNYRGEKREIASAQAAAEMRRRERAEDKAFTAAQSAAERAERAAERKAADAKAAEVADRAAARWMVDNMQPGPVSTVTAQMAARFPELAGRFRDIPQPSAPMGPDDVGPVTPEAVLEPSAAQVAAQERLRADQSARDVDDARMAEAAKEAARHNQAMEGIARTNAAARPDNTQQFVIRDGKVVPITKGEAKAGDVPYSAEAMQGMGGESADARSMRTAAALNSIEKLKSLAPVRTPGPVGLAEGAVQTVKGALGYQTNVRQYNAMLGPTAMQMAVAIQGAAGLSNSEREAMKNMLGTIHTMDYESQMALLENASQMIRTGADVDYVTVMDPKTKQPVQQWVPKRSRMPGAVTIQGPLGQVPSAQPDRIDEMIKKYGRQP